MMATIGWWLIWMALAINIVGFVFCAIENFRLEIAARRARERGDL